MRDYITINRHLRALRERISDLTGVHDADGYAEGCISDYIQRDLRELRLIWPEGISNDVLDAMDSIIAEQKIDGWELRKLASAAEDQLDAFFIKQPSSDIRTALKELLDPAVEQAAYRHYLAGHYREAALNAVMAVFDLLRQKSGLDLDGAALVTQALSLENPILQLADIKSQSGRSIQVGFIDMLKGAYAGIRNPKAHRLETDLNAVSTAQYLVFASLLARKLAASNRAE
ncbi:TIGR02391 family protein [Rheinheimera sp. NSM]|uniref:TIGR02391 family protein n=1 Tax=Rheinheimera sp. NSM TaxID=3457884 RepID=UPI0040371853